MSFFSNLKIGRKLAVSFAVLVLLSAVVSGVIYSQVAFVQKSIGWTTHTYEVLDGIDTMVAAMVNQETGVRGYLVSGDTGFLEPYKNGKVQFEKALADVREMTSDNATQQGRLDAIAALAHTWQADIAEKE